MKQARPGVKKTRKTSSRERQHSYPPRVAVGWGRGGSAYRPGLFTKQYFVEHGEACCADIYYALSQEIERLNKERVEIGEKPLRRPNYSSFARYFHWFKLLGFIEPIERQEPSIYDFLEQRQFYQLTAKGQAEEQGWLDPISVRHPELR
jgi:hypothetical protein